ILGLVTVLLVSASCSSSPPKSNPNAPGAASGPPVSSLGREFHPGETITVKFSDTPQPLEPYNVNIKEDGTVTLLLNKDFTFAGKTQGAMEKEIHDYYVPRFYKYLTVSIKHEVATLFYYVDGEVKNPSRYPYIERTTVLKAIASSGGFTD